MIYGFSLIGPSKMVMNYVELPFNMGMFYWIKVSFNMGTFLDS